MSSQFLFTFNSDTCTCLGFFLFFTWVRGHLGFFCFRLSYKSVPFAFPFTSSTDHLGFLFISPHWQVMFTFFLLPPLYRSSTALSPKLSFIIAWFLLPQLPVVSCVFFFTLSEEHFSFPSFDLCCRSFPFSLFHIRLPPRLVINVSLFIRFFFARSFSFLLYFILL